MKKTVLTVLQIVITLFALWVVFHDPVKRANTWHAILGADKGWILAAILAYGAVEILAALRWQILLRVQGIRISMWRVIRLLMIGILFNPVMPGGTGGDVVKIFFLLKETPDKKAPALLAVLMDRLIGLVGLILVTAVVIGARFEWLQQFDVTRGLTWTFLGILGAAALGIAFSFTVTGFNLVHKLPAKMPGRDKLIDLSIAYDQYAKAWRASLLSIFISLGVHIGSFLVFYYAALALHVQTALADFMAVIPIIVTLSALPISVGGAGVREKLFASLLGPLCGVPESTAIATSLLGFAVLAFWAIIGGFVYLTYRPSEHARLSEMQKDVKTLEHEIAETK